MKAIAINVFVEQYADLAVSDVPAPTPKAGEVLVTITHAGLNHVDLLYARGAHQNNASGLVTPPFVLGLEFAGTVAAVAVARRGGGGGGGKCREAPPPRFHVGERVWGSAVGALAEQIAVPESSLQRVPAGWRAEEVAGLGAATAPVSYGALVRVAKVQSGERVLVHAAAGGLGVVAGQIARALGVRVVATVGSAAKADVVRRQLGVEVDAVLRYDEAGWEKEVLEASGGKGVDVVFDTVGLVEKSLRCLRYGGRVVVAGFVGREDKMEKAAMNRILLKGAAVLGYVRETRPVQLSVGKCRPAGLEIWRKRSPESSRECSSLARTECDAAARPDQACHLRTVPGLGECATSIRRSGCKEGLW